ncbi:MAG: hypothetical protein ACM3UV_04870 [Nocardioidaceae bacterium]
MAVFVEIRYAANPFRGDRFEAAWGPVAEAAIDYGATYWALLRNDDGRLDFLQHAIFPSKADFERYWYSERVAQARTECSGLYQVPLLPTFWEVAGVGATEPAPAA